VEGALWAPSTGGRTSLRRWAQLRLGVNVVPPPLNSWVRSAAGEDDGIVVVIGDTR
jgi:hypothetical protein